MQPIPNTPSPARAHHTLKLPTSPKQLGIAKSVLNASLHYWTKMMNWREKTPTQKQWRLLRTTKNRPWHWGVIHHQLQKKKDYFRELQDVNWLSSGLVIALRYKQATCPVSIPMQSTAVQTVAKQATLHRTFCIAKVDLQLWRFGRCGRTSKDGEFP